VIGYSDAPLGVASFLASNAVNLRSPRQTIIMFYTTACIEEVLLARDFRSYRVHSK
jgi:hypothetical protein